MPKVEIYTWSFCPFCTRAKKLLENKGVHYTEYNISGNDEERDKMTKRANGHRTVPQIFIDDQHIGGCDELHELEDKGELDALLKQA